MYNEMNLNTPIGMLTVERYRDTNFPGFNLLLNGHQCGVFEYNQTANAIQIHVWEVADSEQDPVTTTISDAATEGK